ncbi:MAG TPA: hypothetical protein VFX12_00145 [Vicinamibacterales bacterium]|nr:hypothetical protein [Vicinamibacterales bacterium]
MRLTRWRGLVGRTVLLAVAVALVPIPVAASGTKPTAPKAPQVSLRQVVAREAARTPLHTPAAKTTQVDQSKQSTGFFRSPVGIAALAVMAIGTGYAIYSTQHDRIKSPGTK